MNRTTLNKGSEIHSSHHVKHIGCKRGFTQLSKSWYGDANLKNSKYLDRITVGFYDPEGGTSGEFQIVWERLTNNWAPRLCAYNDAWSALFNFNDIFESMAKMDGEDISPDAFADMLESLGIGNMTETEQI